MNNKIPNSVIGAVSSVIAAHYYSHSKLNTLFMESGAPGEPPEGNCETKCSNWLKRCNEDPLINAFEVLGHVIQGFMDQEETSALFGSRDNDFTEKGKARIKNALAKNQLSYKTNGFIVLAGSNPTTKTLKDYLRTGDFSSIEKEFERALKNIDTDPHASITAASSIIESVCKTYIETFGLEMPNKKNILPLWKTVQKHLGLNIDRNLGEDEQKILSGLSSIVDGIGAFRTHIGSAHGRGIKPPRITVAEARLAVNASHTLTIFIMERWHTRIS
ncbi:hypothetical protein FLL45_05220 [Aliikangiella marina]|uniref:Abortive infection protein-like C-terminal domain-containing protein n=1 Tax=Aliikangiella marina TaxID=1712262 RepID=A0A545TJJ1_9GAMM|nr:abortive infection family protein [Aliikangiella marina]TQV77346.1 hypothetical protein FLL45_05220 [Aliikangiella marina]